MINFRFGIAVAIAAAATVAPTLTFGQELKSEKDYIQTAATKILMIKVCGIPTVKGADGKEIDLTDSLGQDIALAQKVGGRTHDEVQQDVLKSAMEQNTLNEQMGINFCAG